MEQVDLESIVNLVEVGKDLVHVFNQAVFHSIDLSSDSKNAIDVQQKQEVYLIDQTVIEIADLVEKVH